MRPQAASSMILHWSPKSPFVRKVMVAAHELSLADRIALRRTVVRMTAPNRDLLPENPLGKIPTLVLGDGTILCDSIVICEFLDSLAGGGRLFPSGQERWVTLSRQAVANGLLDILILWRNERDKPSAAQTASWIDGFRLKTDTALDHFDRLADELSAKPFDIAQVTLGCCLSYLDFRFADLRWREGRPALAAWHEAFRARPSARATEVVDA
jgi:glutathione S-transferase